MIKPSNWEDETEAPGGSNRRFGRLKPATELATAPSKPFAPSHAVYKFYQIHKTHTGVCLASLVFKTSRRLFLARSPGFWYPPWS